ncbi:MAG: Gldg family protein [Myxococcaceae bacterium]|nr:Gldg family protein [Myxococcaceae bacterium]
MNSVLAVARRELKTFFSSPIAYIVLGAFLLLTGWFFFSPLFLAGQASLRNFFSIAAICFVFIVPAITMRSIAEERKSGTLELLLTMPVDDWQVVAGKFLAALGMVCVGLAFTLPYALTVSSLTAPGAPFDWGVVAAGYFGLVLLASSFIALGLWASALSRNQIVGFIIGLIVCFTFFFIDKFAALLPEWLGRIVEYFSVDYHFENIARGVLDTRDLLFYVSVVTIGLVLTAQLLANIRQELSTKSVASPTVFTLAVVGSLILLNVLSLRAFVRFDVTHDKMYTLAPATKETLAGLDDNVTITAYFTADLPAPYSTISSHVRDTLEEFRAASKGKVSFEFIDPSAQESDKDKETKREVKRDIFGRQFRDPTSVEKELAGQGIQSVELPVVQEDQRGTRRAWLGLVIRHHEKKEVIPVVQNLAGLEYDLTTLVRKLTRTKTPVIGLLQGHDEPKPNEKLRNLTSLLSQQYEVRPVELQGKDRFEADLDALLILGPERPLQQNELKAVDQLVMEGKPVALFLDAIRFDMRTAEQRPVDHGLQPLLTAYGVTLQSDQMVADVTSASVNVTEQRGFMQIQMPVPFPFVPVVKRLEGDSPVTKGIGDVTFPFPSKLSATGGDGKTVTVLARSSAKSWTEGKPQNLDPRRDWRSETITFSGPHDLMVSLSGKWKSAFAAEAGMSVPGASPLLAESKGESRLMVAGTSALFQDDFMNRGNQALLLNVADWLLLDPALLAMRTRGLQLAALQSDLPEGTRNAAKFGNAFGLPLALAALGLIRWRMREARRTRVVL